MMTPIAPLITDYLRVYLPRDRGFSSHTCESYSHAYRLLFTFVAKKLKKRPSELCIEHLSVDMILGFLSDIEKTRGNSPSSRNARLAAIKSFMRFLELKLPSALGQVRQIQAIAGKRHDRALVRHLTLKEVQAIINAPDITTRLGIRDRAMLHLCFAGALRVSELVEFQLENLSLQGTASIYVFGKGRRERCLPLWKETAADLRAWLSVRGDMKITELFSNAKGQPMTRAGFEYILDKYTRLAAKIVPKLKHMNVTPHQLRHSCALLMLQATGDIRKVSLWLGHADLRTTEIYLRVDPTVKLETIEAMVPPELKRGKFKAPDLLIASLLGP